MLKRLKNNFKVISCFTSKDPFREHINELSQVFMDFLPKQNNI